MPCESLDDLPRNWDPLKGTRRLPRIDPSGSWRDREREEEDLARLGWECGGLLVAVEGGGR